MDHVDSISAGTGDVGDVVGIRETAKAAINAMRSNTESSSKGHTQAPKSWVAIALVSPVWADRTSPPRAGSRTPASKAVVPAAMTAAAIRWTALEECSGLRPMGARVSMSAKSCLLYTSDAADALTRGGLGGC